MLTINRFFCFFFFLLIVISLLYFSLEIFSWKVNWVLCLDSSPLTLPYIPWLLLEFLDIQRTACTVLPKNRRGVID